MSDSVGGRRASRREDNLTVLKVRKLEQQRELANEFNHILTRQVTRFNSFEQEGPPPRATTAYCRFARSPRYEYLFRSDWPLYFYKRC